MKIEGTKDDFIEAIGRRYNQKTDSASLKELVGAIFDELEARGAVLFNRYSLDTQRTNDDRTGG